MVDPTDADLRLEQLAAAQHGLVSRAQALDAGMTTAQIRARLDQRRLRRIAPGVLEFPGHADSHLRRCWVAILHAGHESALSHRTAALLHGMEPIEPGPVELTVERGRSRGLTGTTRHRPRDLDLSQIVRVHGLPLTSPPRTILDVAALLRIGRLSEVVQHAHVERICSTVAVGAELARTRRRGLPGVQRLESVLDDLGPGDAVPHSELERVGDSVRRLARLPDPVHEHPLPSARGRPGFVDRAWPEVMLITEFDGRRWHTRRQQMDLDRRRDLEASSLGWHPLRLCWEQLSGDPNGTAELWRSTYDRRFALMGGRSPF